MDKESALMSFLPYARKEIKGADIARDHLRRETGPVPHRRGAPNRTWKSFPAT
jgi:hypothetical protein